jgi:RHS repeat-associated protein
LTNRSNQTVYFDQLWIELSKGNLLEENHYYPHGLPIVGLSSVTGSSFKENKRRYQGNEYNKDIGLNWMDFNARQYDPQIGRFLGVDPLADGGGRLCARWALFTRASLKSSEVEFDYEKEFFVI